jgi:hypothetical protein
MRKTTLINEVRQLLNPSPTNVEVFREVVRNEANPLDVYQYKGKVLTREQCRKVPARMHIFIVRRIVA